MPRTKKVKLPFVVQPRNEPIVETFGTEESGQLQIARKGYLSVAEKSFMQQATNGDQTVVGLHRLAGKVARQHDLTPQEVVDMLTKADISNPALEGHEEEVDQLLGGLQTYEQRRQVLGAACLVMFRISQDFSIDDIMNLHPDLISDLYGLYLDEDSRTLDAFEQVEVEPEGK